MAKVCCKTCEFLDKESGDCRRFPPLAQMVPTPERDPLTMQARMGLAKWSIFPQPNKEKITAIWCGEYKASLEAMG